MRLNPIYNLSDQFTPPVIQPDRALCAATFVEMLSLQIEQGVGKCTPQDLCELWPSLPDSDRRLQAFYWYEETDGSGAEYLVLHVMGSSNFTFTEDWWVRLERNGGESTMVGLKARQLMD
jgi:hypothetical protein